MTRSLPNSPRGAYLARESFARAAGVRSVPTLASSPVSSISVAALLFSTAFLAATILPGSSEAALAALALARPAETWMLFAVATIGNTLGSAANWVLGRWLASYADRKWFPVSAAALDRAARKLSRFGSWSLLLAWLPIVGDPLTVAAGLLRVDFRVFLVFVALGKAARYLVVLWGVEALAPLL
jgi:membrane protein YqaA with SNARE-associated domain